MNTNQTNTVEGQQVNESKPHYPFWLIIDRTLRNKAFLEADHRIERLDRAVMGVIGDGAFYGSKCGGMVEKAKFEMRPVLAERIFNEMENSLAEKLISLATFRETGSSKPSQWEEAAQKPD